MARYITLNDFETFITTCANKNPVRLTVHGSTFVCFQTSLEGYENSDGLREALEKSWDMDNLCTKNKNWYGSL